MTPAAKARVLIDAQLLAASWTVQYQKEMSLDAGRGEAVRDYLSGSVNVDHVEHEDPIHLGRELHAKREILAWRGSIE